MITIFKYKQSPIIVLHKTKILKSKDETYYVLPRLKKKSWEFRFYVEEPSIFIQTSVTILPREKLELAGFGLARMLWFPDKKQYIRSTLKILESDNLREDYEHLREELVLLLLIELSNL